MTSDENEREPYAIYAPPPPKLGEDIAAYIAKHAETYRAMDELGHTLPYDPRPLEQRYTRPPYNPTDADWIAQYTFFAEVDGRATTTAARVALADAAPGAFLRDTGREPPSDLIARVFAAAPK